METQTGLGDMEREIETEVRSWGLQGFVAVPDHPRSVQAFYRVPNGKYERVGRAEWVDRRDREGQTNAE